MTDVSIEMLQPSQIGVVWDELEPLLIASCAGNDIAKGEISISDVYAMSVLGMCTLFIGRTAGEIKCVLGLQFNTTNGHKCATVIALAGEKLSVFKRNYWHIILEWLRANEVEFLDACVPSDRADMYVKKFGFDKSCAYIRMTLKEV